MSGSEMRRSTNKTSGPNMLARWSSASAPENYRFTGERQSVHGHLLAVLHQPQQLLRPAIPPLPGISGVVERGSKGLQQRAPEQRRQRLSAPLAVRSIVGTAEVEREEQTLWMC